jgi:predicted amidohydrolase
MPHPRTLSFPMNKAEYISALYNTLAAIGHEAGVQGRYSKVIPPEVEQKLIHLRQVMDWVSNDGITFDRIAIDEEGGLTVLPIPPEVKHV